MVVNGKTGRIQYIYNQTIFVKAEKSMLPIFPVYDSDTVYYPIVPGYASTIHKVMGQDIEHVTLAFDRKTSSAAVGYVAISRVSSINNIVPVIHLRKSHFINKQ